MRHVKCYIFAIFLYGVELQTLNEKHMKNLKAFKIWTYRRMLRISLTERVRNEQALRRPNQDNDFFDVVKIRKLQYLGNIMSNNRRLSSLDLIIRGKMEGKRGPGCRRISWKQNLGKWQNLGKTSIELIRLAVNKTKITCWLPTYGDGQALEEDFEVLKYNTNQPQ